VIPFTPPDNTAEQPGGSELLDRIMVLLQNTFRSLAGTITNGALIQVSFDATAFPAGQRVFHGLGRQPVTFEAVNMQAPGGVVFESAAANPYRSKYLLLQCSADAACAVRFT
jgi:hypothetical protein